MDPRLLALQQYQNQYQQQGFQQQQSTQAFRAAAERQQQQMAMLKEAPNEGRPPVFGRAPQGWQNGMKRGWGGAGRPPGLGGFRHRFGHQRNATPPANAPAGQPPAAPGVSSRVSPGTVPMKKGLR